MTYKQLVEKYEKYPPHNLMKYNDKVGGPPWTLNRMAVHTYDMLAGHGWISFYRYGERFGQHRNSEIAE